MPVVLPQGPVNGRCNVYTSGRGGYRLSITRAVTASTPIMMATTNNGIWCLGFRMALALFVQRMSSGIGTTNPLSPCTV